MAQAASRCETARTIAAVTASIPWVPSITTHRRNPIVVPSESTDASPPAPTNEPDVPSVDDADANDDVGVDLALRALGATQIGEIEH